MPEGGITAILRIHCICGQKMKVSESMLGRPGKCVACGQEIRIPTLEELPPATEDVRLKDHPEFLQKGKRGRAHPIPEKAGGPVAMNNPDVVALAESRKRPKRYTLSLVSFVFAAFTIVALTAILSNVGGYLDKLTPGNSTSNFTKTNITVAARRKPPSRYQDRPSPRGPARVQNFGKSSVTDESNAKTAPVEPAEEPKDVASPGTPSTSSAPGEESVPSPLSPPPVNKIDIVLRGVLMKGERDAKFAITLYPPEGPPKNLTLKLGDVIFGPWTVRELNQERQTLTVGNGKRLIVLDRGKRTGLDL